jgi:hypothetical protein
MKIIKQTPEKAFPSKKVLENCSKPYDYVVYPYSSKAGLQGIKLKETKRNQQNQ